MERLAAEKKHAFRIPVLEDHETIQLAITDIVNAMFADRIDAKRAALALWALQTASVNLRHANFGETENAFLEYTPEHDPALPELEEEETPELPEPKPVASEANEEVIESIHAVADEAPNTSTALLNPTAFGRLRSPATQSPARLLSISVHGDSSSTGDMHPVA